MQCGFCCGYRRDSHFGGCSYAKDELVPPDVTTVESEEGYTVPVNKEDICIYLTKLNNGFARCNIQSKKPKMCKLFNCLTAQKVRQLGDLISELELRCE